MKICFLITFLFFSINTFSQSKLNDIATWLKKDKPELYQSIKEFSIREWNDDHSMILYEINKQSTGYYESMMLLGNDKEQNQPVFIDALFEWSENLDKIQNMNKNNTINWSMVHYEMKKQIDARNKY